MRFSIKNIVLFKRIIKKANGAIKLEKIFCMKVIDFFPNNIKYKKDRTVKSKYPFKKL